jgi:hypothetical protein
MLQLVIDSVKAGLQYEVDQQAHGKACVDSMKLAATETATTIEQRGRTDISSAGKFGRAWTSGFHSKPKSIGHGVEVVTTMSGRGWRIFQEGRTIHGRPLLWIPLSGTDAKGKAKSRYPDPLVQVQNRAGLPLLISRRDNRPKYFGKESVTIPKKFHLTEIATEEGHKMGERFQVHFMGQING